jgi:hypothetical protein
MLLTLSMEKLRDTFKPDKFESPAKNLTNSRTLPKRTGTCDENLNLLNKSVGGSASKTSSSTTLQRPSRQAPSTPTQLQQAKTTPNGKLPPQASSQTPQSSLNESTPTPQSENSTLQQQLSDESATTPALARKSRDLASIARRNSASYSLDDSSDRDGTRSFDASPSSSSLISHKLVGQPHMMNTSDGVKENDNSNRNNSNTVDSNNGDLSTPSNFSAIENSNSSTPSAKDASEGDAPIADDSVSVADSKERSMTGEFSCDVEKSGEESEINETKKEDDVNLEKSKEVEFTDSKIEDSELFSQEKSDAMADANNSESQSNEPRNEAATESSNENSSHPHTSNGNNNSNPTTPNLNLSNASLSSSSCATDYAERITELFLVSPRPAGKKKRSDEEMKEKIAKLEALLIVQANYPALAQLITAYGEFSGIWLFFLLLFGLFSGMFC